MFLVNQRVHTGEGGLAEIALNWLAMDVRARLIVSRALDVRWANQSALECLGAQAMMHVRAGELVCKTPPMHLAVSNFVATLSERVHTLALEDDEGDDVLLLRGWAVMREEETLACLELALDRPEFRPDYRDVQAVFGLTSAENRTVNELLAGYTVTTIAARLGLSVGTVRTHVKRIYSKVCVTSREELLGRLAPYRIV